MNVLGEMRDAARRGSELKVTVEVVACETFQNIPVGHPLEVLGSGVHGRSFTPPTWAMAGVPNADVVT